MEETRERACMWCDFIDTDRTCALMQALHTESDPRCKYWRENAERCRYFELYVTNTRGRSDARAKGGQRAARHVLRSWTE